MDKQGRYSIIRQRQAHFNPYYWNLIACKNQQMIDCYGVNLSEQRIIFSPDKPIFSFLVSADLARASSYVTERVGKSAAYFFKIKAATRQREIVIKKLLRKIEREDWRKIEDDKLFNYLLEIRDAWVNYDSASTFIWFGAGEEIKTTLGQFLQLQGEELNIFLQPAASYVKKMEIDLWRAALDDKTPLSVRAAQLRKKYWWLPFGYDGPQTWTDGYFSKKLKIYKKFSSDKIKLNIAKIRTEKIKDSRILIKKLQSSPYYWRLYSAFKEGARWTDERKKLISPLHYYYHVILKEISRRLDFPFLNLKYLTVEEILEIDKKKSYILKLSADRMNKVFMAVGKGGKVFFSNRKELIKYKKIIAIQPLRSVISGVVACRGPKLRYIAKVKILLSSQEYKKLRAGDFLVTSMTTPDFAIAMKKAAGLITDEGGATCHAAIMSREMGKPCIVATKISTKVFHDGDQVEVDTVEGTIKIMNKK